MARQPSLLALGDMQRASASPLSVEKNAALSPIEEKTPFIDESTPPIEETASGGKSLAEMLKTMQGQVSDNADNAKPKAKAKTNPKPKTKAKAKAAPKAKPAKTAIVARKVDSAKESRIKWKAAQLRLGEKWGSSKEREDLIRSMPMSEKKRRRFVKT